MSSLLGLLFEIYFKNWLVFGLFRHLFINNGDFIDQNYRNVSLILGFSRHSFRIYFKIPVLIETPLKNPISSKMEVSTNIINNSIINSTGQHTPVHLFHNFFL